MALLVFFYSFIVPPPIQPFPDGATSGRGKLPRASETVNYDLSNLLPRASRASVLFGYYDLCEPSFLFAFNTVTGARVVYYPPPVAY